MKNWDYDMWAIAVMALIVVLMVVAVFVRCFVLGPDCANICPVPTEIVK
jgi:hypothetical protein